jgi:hypothetical protein
MTSQTTIGPEQQHLEGRTVRDIVEYSPEQVNEVWCRKIFRQILQSLELQYAMHMPHRAITPDTIVFHDNGEPLLIPLDVSPEEAREPEDLNALARTVHYAITRELAPTGPLAGRAEGYSDSLVGAVDRCMDPDPARRPQSIEQLRDLLGIVPLGPPVGAAVASHMTPPAAPDTPIPNFAPNFHPDLAPAAAPPPAVPPAFTQTDERPRRRLNLSRWQRWAVAAGGGAVLIALALAMFAEMRDSGSFDHIVLTLPQQADKPHADMAATGATAAGALDSGEGYVAPDTPASSPAAVPQTPANPSAPIAAPQARPAPDTRLPGVVVTPNGNVYRLQIQPWGVVYVDDVDRGVSPPIKRLVLAPGRHTIRVTNPNFHDRVLEVDTANGDGQITVDFNSEPR